MWPYDKKRIKSRPKRSQYRLNWSHVSPVNDQAERMEKALHAVLGTPHSAVLRDCGKAKTGTSKKGD
jgi:hypothetical protein